MSLFPSVCEYLGRDQMTAAEHTPSARKTVCVADIQPISIEGLKSVCSRGNVDFAGGMTSLPDVLSRLGTTQPDIWVVDNNFGCHAVHSWIRDHNTAFPNCSAVIVWGTALSEREIFEYTRSGSRGVIRKTAELGELRNCLASVAAGRTWVERPALEGCFPNESERAALRDSLTQRERQVLAVLQKGFTTKRMAAELGISPCTTKIHLKNIYQKAGVENRYGLLNSILVEVEQSLARASSP